MRYLLKEQPYEKPLAAGRLRYRTATGADGAIEHWRLTAALEGYRVLRLDLDEREVTGRSILFYILLDDKGLVENLRFRFFAAGARAQGQVLVEPKALTVTRTINGERYESEIERSGRPVPLFVRSAAGLGLLRPWTGSGPREGLTLDFFPQREDHPAAAGWFAPRLVELTCEWDLSTGQTDKAPVATSPDGQNGQDDGQDTESRLLIRLAGRPAEGVALTLRDPYGVVTAASWPGRFAAVAERTIHYRASKRI